MLFCATFTARYSVGKVWGLTSGSGGAESFTSKRKGKSYLNSLYKMYLFPCIPIATDTEEEPQNVSYQTNE